MERARSSALRDGAEPSYATRTLEHHMSPAFPRIESPGAIIVPIGPVRAIGNNLETLAAPRSHDERRKARLLRGGLRAERGGGFSAASVLRAFKSRRTHDDVLRIEPYRAQGAYSLGMLHD